MRGTMFGSLLVLLGLERQLVDFFELKLLLGDREVRLVTELELLDIREGV